MSVLEYVLAPFLYLIEQVFLLGYAITGDYGLSIVFLSFVISVLLLPVFTLIEKAKKKDDVVKGIMQPYIDEIKRCYKGQERHYYLKTINRQHKYNPVRSLIPTLSLILQIPFFIAAYQFLEGFTPLAGESFLFINDLNAPDGLFGSINILPIAMTVVNLITAYFYTRNGNIAELKQMTVVAVVFLVLLFNLPAGLVLYWTLNNVFSFFRLFITNPEAFKKTESKRTSVDWKPMRSRFSVAWPKLKITFLVTFGIVFLVQLDWLFQNKFNGAITKLSEPIVYSIGLLAFLALVVLLYKVQVPANNANFKVWVKTLFPFYKPTFIILSAVIIISQANWALENNPDDLVVRLFMAVPVAALVTFVIASLSLTLNGQILTGFSYQKFKLKHYPKVYRKIFAVAFMVIATGLVLVGFISEFNSIISNLVIAVVVIWCGLLLFANGLLVYQSIPSLELKQAKMKLKSQRPKFISAIFIVFITGVFFQYAQLIDNSFKSSIGRIAITFVLSFGLIHVIILLWGISEVYRKTISTIRIHRAVYYGAFFIAAYLYYVAVFSYTNIHYGLLSIALIVMLLTQITTTLFVLKANKEKRIGLQNALKMGFLILFVIQLVSGWLLLNTESYSYAIHGVMLPGVVSIFFSLALKHGRVGAAVQIKPKLLVVSFGLSVFYLQGLIFFWNPLLTYSSFPEIFSFPAVKIITSNFKYFAIGLGMAGLLFYILPKSAKLVFTVVCATFAVFGFVYSFILPVDVGSLQMGKFVNADSMVSDPIYYIFEGVSFIALYLLIIWLVKTKKLKQLNLAFGAILLIVIVQSLSSSVLTGSFMSKEDDSVNKSSSLSFSKDKENVVFFIADMFLGWHLNSYLEEYPEFKDELEGFVWYPNTTSVSSITATSIAPILCGYDYTIDKLNIDEKQTVGEKITHATELFRDKVKANNYALTSNKMVYSSIDKNTYDKYIPDWHEKWNEKNGLLNIGTTEDLDLTVLWKNALFFASPLFLKLDIYNDGKWIGGQELTNQNTEVTRVYNFIKLLPHISDTLSVEKSFIYIHSEATHLPWNIVNEQGNLESNVPAYDNQLWFLQKFVAWIQWMKEHDVYNNTKIILLSDHGLDMYGEEAQEFGAYLKWGDDGQKKISAQAFWRLNPLLMVKDLGASGQLQEDWRFMSNADAPAIVFNEDDPTKGDALSRKLPVSYVNSIGIIDKTKQVDDLRYFEVKNTVYSPQNWQVID